MKPYILLPFVLLAGLVVGGLGPRAELSRVKDELEKTRKLVREQGGRTATMSNVSNLLGIEHASAAKTAEPDSLGTAEKSPEDVGSATAESSSVEPEAQLEAQASVDDKVDPEEAPEEKNDFSGDLDRAIELWQTRVAIARNTFVSNARLSDAQAVKFDTLLTAMNVRIGTTIDAFAKEVSEVKDVQPEAGIRLVNDITESMVLTYDEMDNAMPKGWRQRAGDKFSVTDFVDPEVARPLVGIEGGLDRMIR